MVPVVYDPAYQDYCFGPEHPFSPVRLQMLLSLLDALGHPVESATPPPATADDLALVHDDVFIEQVTRASSGEAPPESRRYGLGTMDVPVFAGMDAAARALVGGTLHAARLIDAGEATTVLQLGGGLHHAHRALASGFCVYNDLSVAIAHLRRQGHRVAYIDVDVHHGDGVQALHYDDPDVLTISLHESGRYLFPGTGRVHEIGEGAGTGFALNMPLEPRTDNASFLDTFERIVPEALHWFQPDVLVVQCGADAHYRDPLADLILTSHAYERLFRRLVELTHEHADGRAVFTLGGGYDPDATVRIWTMLTLILRGHPLPERLPDAWLGTWRPQLAGSLTPTLHDPMDRFEVADADAIARQNQQVSRRLMEQAVQYWY